MSYLYFQYPQTLTLPSILNVSADHSGIGILSMTSLPIEITDIVKSQDSSCGYLSLLFTLIGNCNQ